MIAFDYDETGAVIGRRLRGVGIDALGIEGVLVVAHLSKLDGLDDVSNAIDLAELDPDALTAPLWQLSVVDGAVAVDPSAPPPVRASAPVLTTRQKAEIRALLNDELYNHGLVATPNSPPMDALDDLEGVSS